MHLNEIREEAWETAEKNGFHKDRTFGDILALIHSEVSEALEDYRNGCNPSVMEYEATEAGAKPVGIPSEFADIIIRVADAAGIYDIDLDKAVEEKLAFNAKRPFKHGGKVI